MSKISEVLVDDVKMASMWCAIFAAIGGLMWLVANHWPLALGVILVLVIVLYTGSVLYRADRL